MNLNSIDEEIILDYYSKGEEEIFTLLYQKYVNFVYDLGRTMGIPRSSIDDFVQEVFIKLFLKLKQKKFNTKKKFFPWFYSLVRNSCFDFLKDMKRQKDLDLKIENYTSNPYEIDIELINSVREGILNLNSKEREVLFLRFYQGLTIEEIAEVINCSTRNVYLLIENALDKLKKYLL
ncbi:MAG: RNA polymerase sigma factor [Brevinematia bacterium]